VALFAALFLSLSHGGSGAGSKPGATASTTGQAPANKTPTLQAQHGSWQADPYLAHVPSLPVIAPTNPSVVYKANGAQLQRSADGGKTWSALATPADFPQGAQVSWLDVFVSPLNADTLWATADLTTATNGTLPNCPVPPPFAFVGGNVVASGSVPCQVQNVSTDGGKSWRLVKLGFAYMLGSANPDANLYNFYAQYSQIPQAQGTRLYSLTSDGPLASSADAGRLAASADGGKSWQPADGALASAGLHICDFAVVPGGHSIYVVTADTGCAPEYRASPALWRSNDGGAHWTQLALPAGRLVAALKVSGGATPTLYALLPTLSTQSHSVNTTVGPADVFASSDGLKWTQAPAAGVPSDSNAPSTISTTAIAQPDGSLLAPVGGTTLVFYMWRPGAAAWLEQSRLNVVGAAALQQVPAAAAGAGSALWLVSADPAASLNQATFAYSVETYQP
jgi:hypothetical protein